MADGYELVLVSCMVENPSERQQTLSALKRLAGPQMYLLSSLAGPAIDLAVETAQSLQLQCQFAPLWDPKRSPLSIYDYTIPSLEELQSCGQAIGIQHIDIDFDAYIVEESPQDYETRIRNEIYKGYTGRIVVLARPEVISTALSLMGVDNLAFPPVFSMWRITPQAGSSLNTFTANNYEELAVLYHQQSAVNPESLGGSVELQGLLSGMSLTESVVLEQPPAQSLAVSISLLQPAPVSLLEQLFSKELGQLCEAFTAQLGSGISGASGGQAVSVVNSVLGSMRRSLSKQQELLAKEAVDLGKESAVSEEVKVGFQAVLEGQTAVESALNQLSTTLFPAISALKARISALETLEANARQPASSTANFPLTIQACTTKLGDPCAYLTISNRKLYPVWGYVQIYQENAQVGESRTALSFSYLQELNLTDICPLQPGRYQAVVGHYLDRSPISNLFTFAVNLDAELTFPNRNYRYSWMYKNMPNIAEVEENLRNQGGDEAVALLRQLAGQWQNEAQDRVEEFIQIVSRGGGEESIRKNLAERGFQL